ncbi:MAG: AMIN domain-containing protein [Halodesulfovibrio sp.]
MNKNIAMLILSVVLLAMILIVLNQWAFGPSSAPQSGAEFSDILKKSPVVKVPQDAPGVRIPVGNQSEAESTMAAGSANGQTSMADGSSMAPVVEEPGSASRPESQADTRSDVVKQAPQQVQVVRPEPVKPAQAKPVQEKPVQVAKPVQTAKQAAPVKKEAAQAAPKAEAVKKPEAPKPVAQAAPKVASKPAVNALQSVTFAVNGNVGVLEIVATGAFDYKVFSLKQPQRIVIDLNGNFEKLTAPSVKANNLVSGVRLARHEKSVRIVMDVPGTVSRSWDAVQSASNKLRVKLK